MVLVFPDNLDFVERTLSCPGYCGLMSRQNVFLAKHNEVSAPISVIRSNYFNTSNSTNILWQNDGRQLCMGMRTAVKKQTQGCNESGLWKCL